MSYLNHPEMNSDHCHMFFQSVWFSISHCLANMFFFPLYVAKYQVSLLQVYLSIYLSISIHFNGE